jgi:predicted house-cleaning NTP pyrophosphatase (Maf/HAM1 superfamily)
MNKQNIDSGIDNKKRDPDLAAAEIAMKRAAEKARQRAAEVGTGIVVWKDGKVVQERLDAANVKCEV